jgi:SH3 domain protein
MMEKTMGGWIRATGTGICGTLFVIALLSSPVRAQETQYISDRILVPVRSGAGGEYRILNRGLPSGTALTVFGPSEDGVWTEVETRGGTRGWVRTQYLQAEPPAALQLADMQTQLQELRSERDRLRDQLSASESEANEAGGEIDSLATELETTRTELAELKAVSGAALELDARTRRLTTDLEEERAQRELLYLENIRLQERIDTNQLIDGALAVLLGVIIAVIAPRLWPKRRRNDGWT